MTSRNYIRRITNEIHKVFLPLISRRIIFSSPVGSLAEIESGVIWPGDWVDALHFLAWWNGSWHTGADLNRNRPKWDSDKGATVRSIGAGVVVFAGILPGSWGNVVIIEHPPVDNHPLYSRYAHLLIGSLRVTAGDVVTGKQIIGQIGAPPGDEDNHHLHFDVLKTDAAKRNPAHWPGSDRAAVLENYIDPLVFLREHR